LICSLDWNWKIQNPSNKMNLFNFLKGRGFCRYYQRFQACRYGNNCRFLHESPFEEIHSDSNNTQESIPKLPSKIRFPLEFVPFDKQSPLNTSQGHYQHIHLFSQSNHNTKSDTKGCRTSSI
jgi:hypothetical protein